MNNIISVAPSCVVCGDTASGMHYRAMTCEGCKTFFRRNAARRNLLKCDMDDGKCVMNRYLRRHCAHCRMKKCLQEGMEVNRVWDKERVKTRKKILKKPKTKASSKETKPDGEVPVEIQGVLDIVEKAFTKAVQMKAGLVPNPHKEFLIPAPSKGSVDQKGAKKMKEDGADVQMKDINSSSDTCELEKHDLDIYNCQHTCDKQRLVHNACNTSGKDYGNAEKPCCHGDIAEEGSQEEMSKCWAGITTDRFSTKVDSSGFPVGSLKAQSEVVGVIESSSPAMSPKQFCHGNVDKNEASDVLGGTIKSASPKTRQLGILDNSMTSYIMQISLLILRQMITFAKELPTFATLQHESQAALVKGAFVEYIFLHATSNFDLVNKRVNSFFNPGTAYDHATCEKAGLGNAFDLAVQIANRLQSLHLNKAEEAMIYALSILSPDRPELEETAKTAVGLTQEHLADTLRISLQSKHKENKSHFPKAMMVLTDLRNATETYINDVMQVELHSHVITPLLAELFDM